MAATSLTLSGVVSGMPDGTHQITHSVATSRGATDLVYLASGFNSITIPSGMTGMLFTPPAGNAVTITLKGVTGDTGVPLHLTDMQKIRFATGATTVGITAGATLDGCRIVWF